MLKTITKVVSTLSVITLLLFGSIQYQWAPSPQGNNTYDGQIALHLAIPQPILNILIPQQTNQLQQRTAGSLNFQQAILTTAQHIITPIVQHSLHQWADSMASPVENTAHQADVAPIDIATI